MKLLGQDPGRVGMLATVFPVDSDALVHVVQLIDQAAIHSTGVWDNWVRLF